MAKGKTKKARASRSAPEAADAPQNKAAAAGPGKVAGAAPAAGVYEIDTGTAELIPDGDNPSGWLLKINGVQSSHIDLADPLRLEFEYMRWMARLIESRFGADDPVRALHLGGGACSMARYLAAANRGARQVVVEIDGRLAELVRGWFNIPRAPLVRIRVGEARQVTESLTAASRDLVIRDVFAGRLTPAALTSFEFTEQVRRVLTPGGLYLVNCGDTPDLARARQEVATIGAVFKYVALTADPPMLKGRRYGNVVIAGSDAPLEPTSGLIRSLLGGGVPAQFWDDARARKFSSGVQPLTDAGTDGRPPDASGGQ